MRLRPFISSLDFDEIKNWMPDERTHAMWCANIIKYPIKKSNFENVMAEIAERFKDTPFVATDDEDNLIGFFCYSLNLENNEGMLKFVMINPKLRGKGFGKQMIKLALEYAFKITGADSVQLNVFAENTGAKKCYEGAGFSERTHTPGAFTYKNEVWGRCNMVFQKPE